MVATIVVLVVVVVSAVRRQAKAAEAGASHGGLGHYLHPWQPPTQPLDGWLPRVACRTVDTVCVRLLQQQQCLVACALLTLVPYILSTLSTTHGCEQRQARGRGLDIVPAKHAGRTPAHAQCACAVDRPTSLV